MRQISLIMICMCLAIGATAYAQNAKPDSEAAPDKRLEQKISIKSTGHSLEALLADISSKTGVKMSADEDVADNKIVVLVKDLPLSKLQEAITKVLHLKCSQSGKQDEWEYEFWQDLKTKNEIADAKKAEIDNLHSHVDKLFREYSDMESQGKKPEDIDKVFKDPGKGAAFSMYSQLNPDQLKQLWGGKRVVVDMKQVPEDQREQLNQRCQTCVADSTKGHEDDSGREEIIPENMSRFTMKMGRELSGNRVVLAYGIELEPDYSQEYSEGTSILCGYGSYIYPPEKSRPEIEHPLSPDIFANPNDPNAPGFRFEPAQDSEKEDLSYCEALQSLADSANVNIVSDYFTHTAISPLSSRFKFASMDSALIFIAFSMRSSMEKDGNIRLLTSQDWMASREREIPERLVSKWKKIIEEYKGIRIQEATQIASLNPAQIADLPLYGLGDAWVLRDSMPALRLAASLTRDQWTKAFSADGVNCSTLSESQMEILRNWIANDDGSMVACIQSTNKNFESPEKLRNSTFKIKQIASDDNMEVKAKWVFSIEPPKDKNPDHDSGMISIGSGKTPISMTGDSMYCTLDLSSFNRQSLSKNK